MSIFELLAAPFAECLVLVAIHTYMGIHVLKRRVIFVDLALAQIAALGTTVGFLLGILPETPAALVFAMLFAFLGAAVFSITRFRREKVPQEAIIGLTYAIACALAVLVVEKTQGAEHLKDILVGSLLWVTWSDVALAAGAYAVIGGVHWIFRRQFLLISNDPDKAYAAGLRVKLWDFLFYVTFGAMITFSTRVAGVLLVFVFLVAPAILAFAMTNKLWLQLVIGWVTGTLVTVFGLYLSWILDLPSGPAVIAFYGVALILGGSGLYFARAKNRLVAARNLALGTLIATLVGLGIWSGGRWLAGTALAASDDAARIEQEVEQGQAEAKTREDAAADDHAARLGKKLGDCVGQRKIERYLKLVDPEAVAPFLREKLAEKRRAGLEFLAIALVDEELPLLYREELLELLRQSLDSDLGFLSDACAEDNTAALRALCQHIQDCRDHRPGAGHGHRREHRQHHGRGAGEPTVPTAGRPPG